MIDIEDVYISVIHPLNMVAEFKSRKEFEEWLELGTIEDIECCLEEFEKYELFEHCIIIRDFIKTRNGKIRPRLQ